MMTEHGEELLTDKSPYAVTLHRKVNNCNLSMSIKVPCWFFVI